MYKFLWFLGTFVDELMQLAGIGSLFVFSLEGWCRYMAEGTKVGYRCI